MTVNGRNVLVGAPDQATTGAIQSAPLDTALPAEATAPIPEGFESSGYISEDGLNLTPERNTTEIRDWSGAVIRRILESFTGTMSWSHIEVNQESLNNSFGEDNVDFTEATLEHGNQLEIRVGAHELPRKSWIFRMKDGSHRMLIVVPEGQITDTGEISFTKANAINLPVTLSCYPDEDGHSIYIYTDDGKVVSA